MNDILIYFDIPAWSILLPDEKSNLVKKGSEPFQNKYGPFSAVQRQEQKSKGSSQHLTTS